MKYILLVILLPISIYGTTIDHNRAVDMEGKWVEVGTKTDTLFFTHIGETKYLMLKRGNELRNGVSRPRYRSGPYHYEILNHDSIALRWSLSSDIRYEKYYFKQVEKKLSMEKFFDINNQKSMLTFEKVD